MADNKQSVFGKNRRDYGTERWAVNAKEAALLVIAITNLHNADERGFGELSKIEVEEIAGTSWSDKLQGIATSLSDDVVKLDVEKLEEIATSPAGANEISILVSRRFGGAQKAMDFINARTQSPNQDQHLIMSEGFMDKFLGPCWSVRLTKARIMHTYTPAKQQGEEAQVLLPIADVKNVAIGALAEAARIENMQPNRRKY